MDKLRGFTLIELMVALGLAAILASIAIPSFATMVQDNRISSHTNEFVAALATARSEAVKRGVNMTVCRSADQAQCNTGTNWHEGWIVFLDPATSGTVDSVDDPSEIVKIHDSLKGYGLTLDGNAQVTNAITYRADGTSDAQGTFTLCDDRGSDYARAIIVTNTGRFRTVTSETHSSTLTCP